MLSYAIRKKKKEKKYVNDKLAVVDNTKSDF